MDITTFPVETKDILKVLWLDVDDPIKPTMPSNDKIPE